MPFRLEKFVTIFRHRYFIRVIVLVLLNIIIITQVRFVGKTFFKNNRPDLVSRSEARFAATRRGLPQRGFIGYLAAKESQEAWAERYFLAQYALAPLVLRRLNTADSPLVLADFDDQNEPAKLLGMLDFEIQADFGDGVKLLHRRPW